MWRIVKKYWRLWHEDTNGLSNPGGDDLQDRTQANGMAPLTYGATCPVCEKIYAEYPLPIEIRHVSGGGHVITSRFKEEKKAA